MQNRVSSVWTDFNWFLKKNQVNRSLICINAFSIFSCYNNNLSKI